MHFLLPHLIRDAAGRAPDHEAFRFQDQALTYGALWQQVNRLARVLRDLGVQRGDRVGIYLHKSLESAIAVHGIMQAGAAYVPLDPAAPTARLRDIIADCAIRHLVTHAPRLRGVRALLADGVTLDGVVGVSAESALPCPTVSWDAVAAVPFAVVDPGTIEHDLAYIMYTSGSTGVPKGIMHTHASGLAYARLAQHTYAVTAADRLANFAPLHFDQSTFEYFTGPLAGATTVIVPEPHMRFPANLSALVEQERITVWYSVPFALIQMLLRGVLDARDCSALRLVVFGGEPFPPKHLQALMAHWPQAQFSNSYGPAETNQCNRQFVDRAADPDAPVPIGRLWENTEALILDDDDRPVADGDSGELLLRTPTMMQGYWNRPDLNARAFYHRERLPGLVERFYRTGDLVRRDGDGVLWFIGRKDRQVKTRGFRVELDEVEAALAAHPAVEEAAVYPVADGEGSRRIDAAVILRPGHTITATQLAHALRERIPAYAVPQTITIADHFPRTTSGKIDRRALQAQAQDALAAAD